MHHETYHSSHEEQCYRVTLIGFRKKIVDPREVVIPSKDKELNFGNLTHEHFSLVF